MYPISLLNDGAFEKIGSVHVFAGVCDCLVAVFARSGLGGKVQLGRHVSASSLFSADFVERISARYRPDCWSGPVASLALSLSLSTCCDVVSCLAG